MTVKQAAIDRTAEMLQQRIDEAIRTGQRQIVNRVSLKFLLETLFAKVPEGGEITGDG